MKVSTGDWWNDTDTEDRNTYSEKNLSQCHAVRHKSHMDWSAIESEPRGERPAKNRLNISACIIFKKGRSYSEVNTLRLGYKNQSVNAV